MSRFEYLGTDAEGKEVRGAIEAANRDAALTALGNRLALVIKVSEEQLPSPVADVGVSGRASSGELLFFTHELAFILRAGVGLPEGLELIRSVSAPRSQSRACASQLLADLGRGQALSASMSRQLFFPGFYVAAVQAAESSGTVAQALEQLAVYVRRRDELAASTGRALAYPVLVLCFTLAMGALILSLGLMQLADIYRDLSATLPAPTRALLFVWDIFRRGWLFWVLGSVFLLGLVSALWRSQPGRLWRDRQLLRIPVVSGLVRYLLASRFAQILSMLYSSGTPLSQALELTAEAMGNHTARAQLREAQRRVLQGEGLAQTINDVDCLPPTLRGMVAVGESSGNLELALKELAAYCEFRLQVGIEQFLAVLDPLLTLMVGLVVGTIILVLGLPFLNLSTTLSSF